jgi:large subunit ribosomal protein L15
VDVPALQAHGLVSGRWPVKCLATGALPHALTVRLHAFSGKAREAIQAAGGSAEVVGA